MSGRLDVPLHVPILLASTLAEAVIKLGGKPTTSTDDIPLVSIGGEPGERSDRFHIRSVFSGWRGGIVPGHSSAAMDKGCNMPLAAMLSAAIAVNEAYQHIGQNVPAAGRRPVGISLWDPAAIDWMEQANDEPDLLYLPSRLWLIGLGHLGQAYLWALGLLPYRNPAELCLVLQDKDRFTPSSDSTCLLSDFAPIGAMKTRALPPGQSNAGFQSRSRKECSTHHFIDATMNHP